MIPVLICPVVSRYDLLERMFNSIDHPVGKTVIVDNGMAGWTPSDFDLHRRLNFDPILPISGLGYGGAINAGIMQTADAPWWMWASNDVVWHPGALEEIAALMDGHKEPRIVTGGFTWAAVNPALINEVGLIDEWSFFPIYYDDNDYQYRCQLAGVDWVEWWDKGTDHGSDGKPGSMTINSDQAIRRKNDASFQENGRRYVEKWGGMPRKEVYKSPWNKGWPVWVTKPDITGRAMRIW